MRKNNLREKKIIFKDDKKVRENIFNLLDKARVIQGKDTQSNRWWSLE